MDTNLQQPVEQKWNILHPPFPEHQLNFTVSSNVNLYSAEIITGSRPYHLILAS